MLCIDFDFLCYEHIYTCTIMQLPAYRANFPMTQPFATIDCDALKATHPYTHSSKSRKKEFKGEGRGEVLDSEAS